MFGIQNLTAYKKLNSKPPASFHPTIQLHATLIQLPIFAT